MIVKNRQKILGPILFYRFVLIFLFLLLLLLLFVCLIVIYFFIILIVDDDDDDNDDFHFTIRVFLFYLNSSVHYFYSIRFVSNKIFDSSATMLNKFCFVLFFAYFILHFLLFSPNNNVLPSTFFIGILSFMERQTKNILRLDLRFYYFLKYKKLHY